MGKPEESGEGKAQLQQRLLQRLRDPTLQLMLMNETL
jgi:hypothetical protein